MPLVLRDAICKAPYDICKEYPKQLWWWYCIYRSKGIEIALREIQDYCDILISQRAYDSYGILHPQARAPNIMIPRRNA